MIQINNNELDLLKNELLEWKRTPYVVISVVTHEVSCNTGMLIYVDSWPRCKAVVALAGPNRYLLYLKKAVYLDATDCEALYQLLCKIPITWTKDFVFACIPQYTQAVCEKVAIMYGHLNTIHPEYTMVQAISIGANVSPLPEGFQLDALNIGDVKMIADNWPHTKTHGRESVENRIKHFIINHPNVGIRNLDGQLVGYELMCPQGTMGMLTVLPAYRKLSLGSVLVNHLSHIMASQGLPRYLHTGAHNEACITLHKKCGFHVETGSDIIWSYFTAKG